MLTLGGWLVTLAQRELTYNRLMMSAHHRAVTPLEWTLLTSGLLLVIAHLVVRLLLHGAPMARPRHGGSRSVALRLAALTALFAAWYSAAVAQWYLVIRSASTNPSAFTRDPTILEHLLLVGGAMALLALAAHVLLQRRPDWE